MNVPPLVISLVVEGDGDAVAVPELIRQALYSANRFNFSLQPNPIRRVTLGQLLVSGQLERYVGYAASKDADAVLLVVDNDDHCAKEAFDELSQRCNDMSLGLKVGICFLTREFESLFLYCLEGIAKKYPEYRWNLESYDPTIDFETTRNAKGEISRLMARDKAYKETRDQVKFVSALDHGLLRERSRSYQHLEKTLKWLMQEEQ